MLLHSVSMWQIRCISEVSFSYTEIRMNSSLDIQNMTFCFTIKREVVQQCKRLADYYIWLEM